MKVPCVDFVITRPVDKASSRIAVVVPDKNPRTRLFSPEPDGKPLVAAVSLNTDGSEVHVDVPFVFGSMSRLAEVFRQKSDELEAITVRDEAQNAVTLLHDSAYRGNIHRLAPGLNLNGLEALSKLKDGELTGVRVHEITFGSAPSSYTVVNLRKNADPERPFEVDFVPTKSA